MNGYSNPTNTKNRGRKLNLNVDKHSFINFSSSYSPSKSVGIMEGSKKARSKEDGGCMEVV